MSEIERYDQVRGDGGFMDKNPDGDWISYTDHIAALVANDEIWRETSIDLINRANAAEAALEPVKATVKPLEWVMMYDGSTYHASSILGRWERWDGHYLPPAGYGGIPCEDPVAAAQADYEQRILSSFVPSPALEATTTEVNPVAWLRHGSASPVQGVPFGSMWITDKDDPNGFPVYASPAPTSHALEATMWPDENAVRVAEGVFWKAHDEMAGAAMHRAIAAYLRETSSALEANRELIASFMIRNSFATGHGDTVEDLLSEFQWQLDERRQVSEEWQELCKRTFVVQHNPNCPSPFLVRMAGKGPIDMLPYGDGLGLIRHQTGDVLGFGKTLRDAARAALSDKGDAS
jgi:hypothetical protein